MSNASAEILCSRCGTPFPQERGKTTVTCVVCGQLRPDLDMTLDDDDDDFASALSSGAAGASLRPAPDSRGTVDDDEPASQSKSHVALPTMARNTADDQVFRIDRPYVAMTDETQMTATPVGPRDSLFERLGPVLLIVAPLAVAMAGALNMLQLVSDFSSGAWYAVGTVFVGLLLSTLIGGTLTSGLLFTIRIRWTALLRLVFLATAVAIGYYGVCEVPYHVQVRENALPGILLKR